MSLTIFNRIASVLWVSQKQDASAKYWLCLKIQVGFLKFGLLKTGYGSVLNKNVGIYVALFRERPHHHIIKVRALIRMAFEKTVCSYSHIIAHD